MSTKYLNLVGLKIRRIRYQLGWPQSYLATRLQLAGLDKDRSTLAKIEARLIHVSDFELPYFCEALGVEMLDLYPPCIREKKAKEVIPNLMRRRFSKNSNEETGDSVKGRL